MDLADFCVFSENSYFLLSQYGYVQLLSTVLKCNCTSEQKYLGTCKYKYIRCTCKQVLLLSQKL